MSRVAELVALGLAVPDVLPLALLVPVTLALAVLLAEVEGETVAEAVGSLLRVADVLLVAVGVACEERELEAVAKALTDAALAEEDAVADGVDTALIVAFATTEALESRLDNDSGTIDDVGPNIEADADADAAWRSDNGLAAVILSHVAMAENTNRATKCIFQVLLPILRITTVPVPYRTAS